MTLSHEIVAITRPHVDVNLSRLYNIHVYLRGRMDVAWLALVMLAGVIPFSKEG